MQFVAKFAYLRSKIEKKISGEGAQPQTTPLVGKGQPLPTLHPLRRLDRRTRRSRSSFIKETINGREQCSDAITYQNRSKYDRVTIS